MASKSKKRRKVLGASCILAALIIAGSSFAWFTSSDEVTNRLSATANYGVSIVEDFTPPKMMVPGQEVNKDVAVVNTGSVDAFARVHLINDLQVSRVKYTNAFDSTDANNKSTKLVTATGYYFDKTTGTVGNETYSNDDLKASGVNFDAAKAYLAKRTTNNDSATKEYLYSTYNFGPSVATSSLSAAIDDATNNANDAVDLSDREVRNGVELTANEVSTLQAGGKLVVKANTAIAPADVRAGDDNEYVYVSVMAENRPVMKDSSDKLWIINGGEYYAVTENTNATTGEKTYTVATDPTDVSSSVPTGLTYLSSQIPLKDFSGSTQFLPDETGFYLFERSENKDKNVTNSTAPEYSGYYYVKGTNPGDGKYYALKTKFDGTGDVANSVNTTTVYVDATVAKDDKGVINSIEGLKLKTKTAMADYTKYFGDGSGTKDENGYYPKATTNNPEVVFTFQKPGSTAGTYDEATTKTEATRIKVDYTFGTDDSGKDDIVFYINLADNWSDNWTYVAESEQTGVNAINDKTNALGYFYYNKILDSGKTSEKLITSVTLDSATTPFAYSDLIYDLGVKLDSIQVTYDSNNKETVDAAKETWHTNLKDVNVAVTNYETDDANSIKTIAWTDYNVTYAT